MTLGRIDWGRWYSESEASVESLERAYPPARLLDVLETHLPRALHSTVLELGCAPGRWLAWARLHLGIHPVGLELEEVGVKLSKRLYPDIPIVRADAFRVPFRSSTFDAVYALGLLEHFEDPRTILSEALRVLRPGGIGIWAVPNVAPGSICRWHWSRFLPVDFAAHRPYTLKELSEVIEAEGFHIRHVEHNGVYVPHMQRIMGRLPLRGFFRRLEGPRTAASLVVVGERPL